MVPITCLRMVVLLRRAGACGWRLA
jgi:hypothetical protein